MYYYLPPKSSIWGHALGRLRADRARDLLRLFLSASVDRHEFRTANLYLSAEHLDSSLVRSLSALAPDPNHLTLEQSERCVSAIADWENAFSEHPTMAGVTLGYALFGWRVKHAIDPSESQLHIRYGMLPGMTTMFNFDSLETFESVRKTLQDLGLCNLNPKHLKQVRSRKAGKA